MKAAITLLLSFVAGIFIPQEQHPLFGLPLPLDFKNRQRSPGFSVKLKKQAHTKETLETFFNSAYLAGKKSAF